MNPSVSILIPTFNQELRFLKECVDSALGQTFRDIEVIVSNNHSTNGTQDFLRSYSDERLKIVSPSSFLSMNENFAFCATHARGEYISFLSSDDLLLPHAIQTLHTHIEKYPDVYFGCGNIYSARRMPPSVHRNKFLIRPPGDGFRTFSPEQARHFFFPWTMACTWMAGDIIRRDAYERTGGFAKCDLLTTGDVWLTKALLEHGGFMCLDEPLALFRTRSLLKPEIDRDRRLFDFADYISSRDIGPASERSTLRKIRQNVSLAYRLGSKPYPTSTAVSTVRTVFIQMERSDLIRTTDRWQSHGFIYRCFGSMMFALDIARKIARRSAAKLVSVAGFDNK